MGLLFLSTLEHASVLIPVPQRSKAFPSVRRSTLSTLKKRFPCGKRFLRQHMLYQVTILVAASVPSSS